MRENFGGADWEGDDIAGEFYELIACDCRSHAEMIIAEKNSDQDELSFTN